MDTRAARLTAASGGLGAALPGALGSSARPVTAASSALDAMEAAEPT
jgi:hypothetical protein